MSTPPLICRLVLFSALIAVSTAVSGLAYTPPTGVRWETDLNVATVRAEREQRPLFLHFIGNGSPVGVQMVNEVFTQPNIAAQLNANFVMVRINASENPALSQRFAIKSIPTDLVLKPNGEVIHRREGAIAAEVFTGYLAFLKKTIQEEGGSSARVPTTPPATPPVTPPAPSAAGPFTMVSPPSPPQQQNEMTLIPAPAPVVDPFAPQQSVVPSPPAVQPSVTPTETAPSAPGYNPLRSGDMAANPPQQSGGVGPSAQHGPEGIVIPANIPAPAKMMVEVPLALEGFCPVTLSEEERWISGNPAFCTMYQGHIFRFATREALVKFAQSPAGYIPVAMGEDIVLMVDRNKRVNGSRQLAAYCKGRIFLFASQETYDAFAQRPDFYMEIALRYETARKEPAVPVVY